MSPPIFACVKNESEIGGAGNAENWRDLFKPLPFERAASAEEIGAAIAFLASEYSGYTSGSVAVIDAGLSARAQSF